MELSFIGDLCLGRHVREKFEKSECQFVSNEIIEQLKKNGGKVIANLESPVSDVFENKNVRFCGTPAMLRQFGWVDCFSLANNHINDFGKEAISSTIGCLQNLGISYNGLYEEEYSPYIIKEDNNNVAILMCTTRLNCPIEDDCDYQFLNVYEELLYTQIKRYKEDGYLVIVFAHMGSMFCRYPNADVLGIIHKMIEYGSDCIVTSHPHCIGGVYSYQGKPVFYSLGDFLMDGESFRRRRSYAVKLDIQNNNIKCWELIPAITTIDLEVVPPEERVANRILKNISKVSSTMSKERKNYERFYAFRYKLDVISHSFSTIHYIYSSGGFSNLISHLIKRLSGIRWMMSRFMYGSSAEQLKKESISGH